jgi:hypothetical protein
VPALQYADEGLKKDKAFVIKAVKESDYAFQFVDESLKKDKNYALEIIKLSSDAFRYVHESLKKDKEVATAAVKLNAHMLRYVDTTFKKDKEFVLAAVRQNGLVLTYIDGALREDEDVVIAALTQTIEALEFVDKPLLFKEKVALAILEKDGCFFLRLPAHLKLNPSILQTTYTSLCAQLQALSDLPTKKEELLKLTSHILNKQKDYLLHSEHPLLQQTIEAHTIASAPPEPKNPYTLYEQLQEDEPLVEAFAGWRQRASLKHYTFADIEHVICPQSLFESLEKRDVNQEEVASLCNGATLPELKENLLGFGKLIPALLAQKGEKNDPLPLVTYYLYSIFKEISNEDDTHINGSLSNRECRLLKFASMIKECQTGQADAIEQYYIYSVNKQGIVSKEAKIEEVVDSAAQMALKKTLASDDLLKELTGEQVIKQQSHQTLYLQNRYYRQIGLRHTLRFDRHTHTLYDSLIAMDIRSGITIIQKHIDLPSEAKQSLDKALKDKQIAYLDFIAYFEKEFGLKQDYSAYIEFDDDVNPIGVTPLAIGQILKKLDYIPVSYA